MNESWRTLLFEYKKTIACIISFVIHALLFLFIYYYPLRTINFSVDLFNDSSTSGAPSFTALLDTPGGQPDYQATESIPIPIGNQIESPSINQANTNVEESIEATSQEAAEESEEGPSDEEYSADQPPEVATETLPLPLKSEINYVSTTSPEPHNIVIPSYEQPDAAIDTPEKTEAQKAPQKTVRKRRVRKIIRKRTKKTLSSTIFSKENLEKASQQAFKGNYGVETGNTHKYAYVTQRLQAQRMMCYNSRVGKILQGEFARYKTPIVFEKELVHPLPGRIIIGKDGTVKDYICDNPTGVKEFDEFVKKIIMQSKFTPLPKFYAHDTYEIPFEPKVYAKKGTNVFKLYLPEDERYPWEEF